MPDVQKGGIQTWRFFHYTIKIVGRSKGKSVISASAYLNGDVMKNEETGSISYYTSKKEVVYTSLMMCENAPSEWQIVPEENIKRFQKSVRYKRSEDKEAAIKKFKITFQKQRLWNEVLKIEKSADAQLGRSFEFALPKEWSRQEHDGMSHFGRLQRVLVEVLSLPVFKAFLNHLSHGLIVFLIKWDE